MYKIVLLLTPIFQFNIFNFQLGRVVLLITSHLIHQSLGIDQFLSQHNSVVFGWSENYA